MQIIDRIMLLIGALGFSNQTEFMRDLELSHTTIGRWKKSNRIDATILSLIECKYNVSRAWLRDGIGNMFNQEACTVELTEDEKALLTAFKQLPPKDKLTLIAIAQDKHELNMYRATVPDAPFISTQLNMNQGNVNNIKNQGR